MSYHVSRSLNIRTAAKNAVIKTGLLHVVARVGGCRLAILRYHSVLPVPEQFRDSIGTGIIHSTQDFASQMELVASNYHPVTLDEVCAYLKGEIELRPRSVAVTFDDGFADNLEHAAPILARTGVPAAVYLAVNYIGNPVQPWYLRLRYAFAVTTMSLWKSQDGLMFDMSSPRERQQAFLDSSRSCAQLCGHLQEELLSNIETRLNVEPFSVPVMLTWTGAKELARQGHIIGSHTLSHPNMTFVHGQDLKSELIESKSEIERNIAIKVKHFSYPSPIMEPHFSKETIAVTSAAGYESAVTCAKGAITKGDDPLSLRRLYVPPTASELHWALENSFAGRSV